MDRGTWRATARGVAKSRTQLSDTWASQVALVVKKLAASAGDMETWVRSLGREDPLEKQMVTHSSILAWEIPWTGEPGRVQSMGSQKSLTQPSDSTTIAPTSPSFMP